MLKYHIPPKTSTQNVWMFYFKTLEQIKVCILKWILKNIFETSRYTKWIEIMYVPYFQVIEYTVEI